MSFPNIPNVDPVVDVTTEDAVNLLLASIAFEELGLAHIINAEAEKIQSILGTLEHQEVNNPTIDELERIDAAVDQTLKNVIKTQILLQFKLENILGISTSSTTTTTTTTTTSTSTTTTSTTRTTTSTTTTTTSTTRTTTSTTTTTTSTTRTTTSTTTTTTSTTRTTTSTTTTTTSTTRTTTSTTTTTTSTTRTTTSTTTSTTSTSTTTTKGCHCSIQSGSSGSGTVPNQTGVDPRFIGGTANIQDPSFCDNCGSGAADHIAYQVNNQGVKLTAVAQLNTIQVQCPETFNPNPTPGSPNTIIITGTANVEFDQPSQPPITGTATFTYTFNDGGTGPNSDSFSITLVSSTPELNHFSGLVILNGNVTIGNCI